MLTSSSVLAAELQGVVKDVYNNGVEAIVYLERLDGTPLRKSRYQGKSLVRIRQKGKQFSPQIATAQVGQSVDFPNDDSVFHNVFSLSKEGPFDLGLYKNGKSKQHVFNTPSIIQIFCNIHSSMFATLAIFDHRFFTTSNIEGRFKVLAPKQGKVLVRVVDKYGNQHQWTVTMPKKAPILLKYSQNNIDTPKHSKKDGSQYENKPHSSTDLLDY